MGVKIHMAEKRHMQMGGLCDCLRRTGGTISTMTIGEFFTLSAKEQQRLKEGINLVIK